MGLVCLGGRRVSNGQAVASERSASEHDERQAGPMETASSLGTQDVEQSPIVLVIDDSKDVHRLLSARLRHEELELRCTISGEEGIAAAKSQRPAIVLLDLDMPDVDGFEVLRRLKEDAGLVNIPVIVLSGLQSPQDKVTAFDLGAVDYVTKPFDLTELRVRVRSAIRISQLVTMLEQRAHIDGLTGMYNREHFDRRWAEETARCRRHGTPLSLAVFDADHFKSINDTFGHPAGDAVLQGISKIIQRESRSDDVACRFGGEEFCLIMPNTGPEAALGVCERIRAAVQGTTWSRHPERTVTISCGLAGASGACAETPAAWLEKADQALYAAKTGGRNRVQTVELPPATKLAA